MSRSTPSPRIYLAGDLVFRRDADALFAAFKDICRAEGLEGVSPFDGQDSVARQAGLFCVDPFRRAPDMDPGTAVEIGYMTAQGKKLAGYTVDGRTYPEKVRAYFAAGWDVALSPAGETPRDADGMLVHS
jgi:nucleoside 2-deoxyribosyltransferase